MPAANYCLFCLHSAHCFGIPILPKILPADLAKPYLASLWWSLAWVTLQPVHTPAKTPPPLRCSVSIGKALHQL